jgi:phage terminase large subunit
MVVKPHCCTAQREKMAFSGGLYPNIIFFAAPHNKMAEINAQMPAKLAPLFRPMRYKVIRGGRGSGKSWSAARALVILSAKSKIRVLCCREVQKSISDSVHRLLADQIRMMGVDGNFDVTQHEIRCRITGSEFIFCGLSNQTVDSIKSYEGITHAWAEEAHSISKRSWDILIPTIRADDSEIWVTFNPDLDTDETYKRFVENPPPECWSIEMNWRDNPWFPQVLEKERMHCFNSNREDYDRIWEGKCRHAVDGAIYADEINKIIGDGRIMDVTYDPRLPVHTVWDMGWNDSMAIAMIQRSKTGDIRVIDYIEESHKTLDWYVAQLNARGYIWGFDWLPHDAQHGNYRDGYVSAADILADMGRKTECVDNISVESGIKIARMALNRAYFDRTKTDRLIQCIRRYKRRINPKTRTPGAPEHDEYSHGADCWRYVAIAAEQMTSTDTESPTWWAARQKPHRIALRSGY